MATQILAPGNSAAASTPETLAAGQSASLFLSSTDSEKPFKGTKIDVQLQKEDTTWSTVATLVWPSNPAVQFNGPATYRVKRAPSLGAVGVERA